MFLSHFQEKTHENCPSLTRAGSVGLALVLCLFLLGPGPAWAKHKHKHKKDGQVSAEHPLKRLKHKEVKHPKNFQIIASSLVNGDQDLLNSPHMAAAKIRHFGKKHGEPDGRAYGKRRNHLYSFYDLQRTGPSLCDGRFVERGRDPKGIAGNNWGKPFRGSKVNLPSKKLVESSGRDSAPPIRFLVRPKDRGPPGGYPEARGLGHTLKGVTAFWDGTQREALS